MNGATPASELTPEERVDEAMRAARSVRHAQIGPGLQDLIQRIAHDRGSTGGRFVFADLAALDAVKGRWEALRDRIASRDKIIESAMDLCNPPAKDIMSQYQARSARKTLNLKREHNQAMLEYAKAYVDKLKECRADMAATDQAGHDRFRGAHGDN